MRMRLKYQYSETPLSSASLSVDVTAQIRYIATTTGWSRNSAWCRNGENETQKHIEGTALSTPHCPTLSDRTLSGTRIP